METVRTVYTQTGVTRTSMAGYGVTIIAVIIVPATGMAVSIMRETANCEFA